MLKKRNKLLPLFGVLVLVLAFFASTKTSYADSLSDISAAPISDQSWRRFTRTTFTPTGVVPANSNNTIPQYSSGYFDLYVYYLYSFTVDNHSLNYDYIIKYAQPITVNLTGANYGNCGSLTFVDASIYGNSEEFDFYPWSSTINNSTTYEGSLNFYHEGPLTNGDVHLGCLLHFRIDWSMSTGYMTHYPTLTTTYTNGNIASTSFKRFTESYILAHGNENLLDSVVNDNSGYSSALASEVTSYDTAESLASTSMAGALPSADTQLSQITQYDYGSLYTDNVSAFAFWKSLGDFVLSNSNLVGIGALLILCLFLGLVVYLLRL